MSDKKFSDFTVQSDLTNFDGVVGYDTSNNYYISPANLYTDVANNISLNTSAITAGTLPIARGGTNSTTSQGAIDTLTNVAGASTGHVLTKDVSGNATFQAPAGGSSLKWVVQAVTRNQFSTDKPSTFGPQINGLFYFPYGRISGFYQPYVIPYDCTLVKTEYYWNASGIMIIDPGETADLRYYKFVTTGTGADANDLSVTSDWTNTGSLGITMSNADNATRPFKSATNSISFTAGEIIAVAMSESGTVTPTTNDYTWIQLYFEAT